MGKGHRLRVSMVSSKLLRAKQDMKRVGASGQEAPLKKLAL